MSDTRKHDELYERWAKAITVKVREGNRVDYLIDGWATFEAMYQAIITTFSEENKKNKTYYIYLLGWYLDDDIPLHLLDPKSKSGKLWDPESTIKKLFEKASREYRVQIRVMLWDQGGRQNTKQISSFNNLATGAGILDNNTLWKWFGSHHQKVLIVKGQQGLIGFCGGVDINPDRVNVTSEQPGSPSHDVHCRIQGNAACDLVDVFVQRWLAHQYHSRIDRTKGQLLGLSDSKQDPNAKPLGEQCVGIARTFNVIETGKWCAKEHSIRSTMLGAIRAAKKFIYIEDQYLWNFETARALGQKLLEKDFRHLTILIAPSWEVTTKGTNGGRWAHWQFMKTLLSGVKEEDGRKARVFYLIEPGSGSFRGSRTYIHAKTWIFDDELAVIGSANCNRRGWESDSEVAAIIFDKPAMTAEPSSSGEHPSFAQTLRMKLWTQHLGVKETKLWDGVGSAEHWLYPGQNANTKVRFYDLMKEKTKRPSHWDTVDPGDAKYGHTPLRSCRQEGK